MPDSVTTGVTDRSQGAARAEDRWLKEVFYDSSCTDELAFLEKLLPDVEGKPDLGHLAIKIQKRVEKLRQEIRILERDKNQG